jgi:CxxC motif-containing protein
MKEISKVTVSKQLNRGDVIIKDVLGLGVDVIATSDLLTQL